ncbi:MAG: hypothetical protein GY941_21520 [Planctomycetes bacterium]|nr:hypothetical protein [Planctomycetota bacterium]
MSQYRRKLKPLSSDFVVCFDHREEGRGKKPLKFPEFEMERVTLKTGDYSIKGYETKVALEHKSGIAELYKDLVVSYRPTFTRFLQRLSDIRIKTIIVEQELTSVAVAKTVQQLRYSSNGMSRLTEATAWHWISKIQAEYGVPIVFCDKQAAVKLATEWMRHAYQQVRR